MCRRQSVRCVVVLSALVSLTVAWAAQPAGAPAEVTFRGRVLDRQGAPVPGAGVAFYVVDYGPSRVWFQVERVKEVTTGSDGAFAFTTAGGLQVYRYGTIVARKEGLAVGWAPWGMRESESSSDIILGEPREFSGHVVDEGDSPVVDAEVSIGAATGGTQNQRALPFYVASEFMVVRTDSTGRFTFSDLPADATCELLVRKPGRATICTYDLFTYSGEKYRFSPGQAGIKVTLPAEARIEGTVVEKAGGRPVGGIQVVAQPVLRGLPSLHEPVTSAPDGTFNIGALSADDYMLVLLRGTTEVPDWVAAPVKVSLKASETLRGVRVDLTPGGLVEVRVKDASGQPVDQAGVDVRDPAYRQLYGGLTDATGLFRTRLAPGPYEISGAYKQGYVRPQQAEAFTVAEGETRTFEQTLDSLPSAAGVVCDDGGKPLEGVTIRVLPGGSGGEMISDTKGQFQVSWDPKGRSREGMVYYLVARHPQRNLAVAQPLEGPGSGVEVKLHPGAIVAGQVIDPNGKGIAGADIGIMLRASTWGSTFTPYRGLKTDAQGRYEVPAIPPDQRYIINVSAEGYGQAQAQLDPGEVTGEQVRVGTCTLALANLSISGVVVDAEGEPVSNVSVSCSGGLQSGQPDRRTRTDAEGRFVLEGVCAGYVRIQASTRIGETYVVGSAQAEGGAADVRITVSQRSVVSRPEPPRPADLKGKPLPDLKKLGIELPAEGEGKALLVCFWDMNQRPSRHGMSELIRRAPRMTARGWAIAAVHAGQVEDGVLERWIEEAKPPFPVGRITGDFDKTRLAWGAASLPHLILTDEKHVVTKEGFGLLRELDE